MTKNAIEIIIKSNNLYYKFFSNVDVSLIDLKNKCSVNI